jgi:hypothetical protein
MFFLCSSLNFKWEKKFTQNSITPISKVWKLRQNRLASPILNKGFPNDTNSQRRFCCNQNVHVQFAIPTSYYIYIYIVVLGNFCPIETTSVQQYSARAFQRYESCTLNFTRFNLWTSTEFPVMKIFKFQLLMHCMSKYY